MVQLIVGNKGKGKTKHLLDKVNAQVQTASGNIVYLDKSSKHMYDLNNKVRLITVPEYLVDNSDEFVGFICGIISQDHDLEQMYFDSFFDIAHTNVETFETVLKKIDAVGSKFNISFVLSVSADEHQLPASVKDKIIVSL